MKVPGLTTDGKQNDDKAKGAEDQKTSDESDVGVKHAYEHRRISEARRWSANAIGWGAEGSAL